MSTPVPHPIEFPTRSGIVVRGDGWGDPAHRHVFLVHGGGQTRHSWGGTAEALATRGWYAVAYDQRGHGDSDWSDSGDYEIDRYGEDLQDIVATCEQPPVVVGASLGGLAGLLLEGHFAPGSCAALVLVDITPRQEAVGVERILEFMTAQAVEGFGSLDEVADAIAAYQPHRERPRNLDGLRKNVRLGEDGRWRWHWDPRSFTVDTGDEVHARPTLFTDAARALALPTLLVRGKLSDLVSEETAAEFLDLCPTARYVDVSDAGHMVAGDRNDRFTEAVVSFLDSLDLLDDVDAR